MSDAHHRCYGERHSPWPAVVGFGPLSGLGACALGLPLLTQSGRLKGWGCGKITRPEIAAMPQLSISWQRLNSASELRNLTATMARMNCATIVGELWSNHA